MEHLQINIRKTNNWGISGFPKKKKSYSKKLIEKYVKKKQIKIFTNHKLPTGFIFK